MERHPLADLRLNMYEMTDIELFALESLHQERIRRSMEALEDIAVIRMEREV